MPTGPNGEKRPASSVSSMVMAMKVATGIEEEQYADGERNAPEERIAAMQVSESKPKKSKKKSRSRSR
ncbi:MAG: hypothetical protein OXF79_04925 [Chloroflexi bacterium]|nr:hypothetical protein [Chloroflexota bacterium]